MGKCPLCSYAYSHLRRYEVLPCVPIGPLARMALVRAY